jgi:hypothetical protein
MFWTQVGVITVLGIADSALIYKVQKDRKKIWSGDLPTIINHMRIASYLTVFNMTVLGVLIILTTKSK